MTRHKKGNTKVIAFSSTNKNGSVITQWDLAVYAVIRKKKREIELELREKRKTIRKALESGATVEEGLREVCFGSDGKRLVFR